jgi:hypothetical protein
MTRTKSLFVVGVVLATFAVAASSRAGNIERTEYLSMNRATALPGVVLPPGSYVFEVVAGHADLVRVSERATKRVLYMGFTDVIRRPDRLSTPLTFGEAPSGAPIPIKVWFPTGLRSGLGFRHE